MKINLIAVHVDNNDNIVGFRLLDSDNGQVMDQPYNAVLAVLQKKVATINGIEYDSVHKKLKGSNGVFDRYPKLLNNTCSENKIVILATVDDIGYRVCNYKGEISDFKTSEVIATANKVGLANGKLVSKDNSQFISAINGNYDNVNVKESKKLSTLIQKKENMKTEKTEKTMNEEKKKALEKAAEAKSGLRRIGDERIVRVVTGAPAKNSKLKEIDENTGMTVEQKMAYIINAMREIRPFYYALFSVLKRNEANEDDGIDTMAVTLDSLYFSSDFVKKRTLPELLFVCFHEVCHVGMKHRVREEHREHDLWNIACDYYINKTLADEFGLTNIGEEVEIITEKEKQSINKDQIKAHYKIAIPKGVLYNPMVNSETDTPEKIYAELEKIQEMMHQGGGSQSKDSKGGKGSGSTRSSSGSGNDEIDNEENANNEDRKPKTDEEIAKGLEEQRKKGRMVGKIFRGQEIDDYDADIVDDKRSSSLSNDEKLQRANSMLSRAVTVHRQTHSFGGDNADFLERFIEKELAPKVNWRSILRNKLNAASQKTNSYSSPDKRFRSRGLIIPGPKNTENNALKNVKICVDTSGSISDRDLGVAMSQIDQLLRTYKAEAELLYWDTRVRAIYPFKDINDLLTKKPMGGGGTDVNCVFDYFETDKDYKLGKKAKPSIIIVFTDGYFGAVHSSFKKYTNTIWVIHDNDGFKEPFGSKAPFKFDR